MLGLQSCHSSESHRQVSAAPQKSGEALGDNRTSPTPSKQVPWPGTDTALLPGRGVCGKLCSQTAQSCPAGHSPVRVQAALLIQRSHSQIQPPFLCPPQLLWGALMALKAAESLSKAPQEPGECTDCAQQCPVPSAQCGTALPGKTSAQSRVRVGSRQLCRLRYLTPVPKKDPGKYKGCLPLSGTQSDSPCSQHLVSLTRQENKDTV